MKNYIITVNGTSYEVSVEEAGAAAPVMPFAAATPAAPTPAAPAPAPAPRAAAPAPAPAPAASAAPAPNAFGAPGSISVTSPMPGKILDVKAKVGDSVSRGDVILILEAMKMENEIVAPEDGTIATIDVSAGASVEAGTLLATLN